MTEPRAGFARVAFDELAWQRDLAGASPAARRVAQTIRARLERDGQPINQLRACQAEGPQTSLPGCVKTYVPAPAGAWGLVFLIARDPRSDALFLDHLAFGVRHPPANSRRPSVYQIAHDRLHRR